MSAHVQVLVAACLLAPVVSLRGREPVAAAAATTPLPGDGVSYIIPKGGAICREGPTDYIKEVLQRLRNSPVRMGWQPATTNVTKGGCSQRGFTHSSADKCFPKAQVWVDDNEQHKEYAKKMDLEFMGEFRKTTVMSGMEMAFASLGACMTS
eukprot:CAMPEP_0197874602 /NCGR_PEP_ID=MMETSP1439-20131203/4081_1 /TAXON_ID=66791 /ORGANISM="Gonyaulax spinifera, Strain CCMP409" /LENGTH=151 /DNA_ID=CAMNT_0043493745 /DNA_START=89 /DNA_END=544 /DNA_ORIENTATION=-